jgi:hypothetical protein
MNEDRRNDVSVRTDSFGSPPEAFIREHELAVTNQ